jgi:YNFM family putative membrane transporter
LFYAAHGWKGVAAFVGVQFSVGLGCAWRLYFLEPLPLPQSPATEPALP